MNSQVTGVTPDYPAVNNLKIASGSFFSDGGVSSAAAKVAVLGSDVASYSFP